MNTKEPAVRDIGKVIKEALEHVPETETDLRQQLDHIYNQAIYTAPEIMTSRWRDLFLVINTLMPAPDQLNDWQKKFIAVCMGKP